MTTVKAIVANSVEFIYASFRRARDVSISRTEAYRNAWDNAVAALIRFSAVL